MRALFSQRSARCALASVIIGLTARGRVARIAGWHGSGCTAQVLAHEVKDAPLDIQALDRSADVASHAEEK